MGAPAGQVQCMICHCHAGCELSKERWRTSSGLFSVYAKWMEAVGVRLLSVLVLCCRQQSHFGCFCNLFVFISRAVSGWWLLLIRGQNHHVLIMRPLQL